MSPLDELIQRNPVPGWRLAAWLIMLLIAAAGGWAYSAQLEEVSSAPAEVVPQGQVKVIQHLEGGILTRIDVAEGQRVAIGDSLVTLDLGAGGLNREELEVQIDGLMLRRNRFAAEAEGDEMNRSADIERRRPSLAATERAAYESRRRQLDSALGVLRVQVRQREFRIRELMARRETLGQSLAIARERLEMSTGLLEGKLISKLEHLGLKGEVARLTGELAELKPAIPRIRAELDEARERVREATLNFRRAAAEELGNTELALARNRELHSRANAQEIRTVVRSPIDGIVKTMRFHTIGGVVGAGEPLMEIVPLDETLVIEARLDPTDIGYVTVGQTAVVKVTTYDFIRYGGLDGRVINVAADSSTDPTGTHYYKVVVQTDRAHLGERSGSLPIIPGMEATVDIKTGERSVIDYLITPVLKLKHEAFRER